MSRGKRGASTSVQALRGQYREYRDWLHADAACKPHTWAALPGTSRSGPGFGRDPN